MADRILLIDDDHTWLAVLKQVLIGQGYAVTTAGSALQGLRLAVDTQPKLVLVDIVMPGVSGLEVCRQLRDNPLVSSQLKVAILSSVTEASTIEQAEQLGVSAYILKSSGTAEIIKQVSKLMTSNNLSLRRGGADVRAPRCLAR